MKHLTLLLLWLSIACLFRDCLGQGAYPPFTSVATYRPITASSVCGGVSAENFCRYTTDATASLSPNCIEDICNSTCPFGAFSPAPLSLATLGSFGVGVNTAEGRPGSTTGTALRFDNSSITVPASRVPAIGERGVSFAVWINQDQGNVGTLISKATSDGLERNYVLTVSESTISLDYLPDTLASGTQRYRNANVSSLTFDPTQWHHITVTVYAQDAVFYVNGSVVSVQALAGRIVDDVTRDVLLGQLAPDVGFYNGLMQDISFFPQALTAREVIELYTNSFPVVHLSSECHCPPSHPLIDPNNEATCVQHPGGNLPSRGQIDRVNPQAHPSGYSNDFATSTGWISSPGQRDVDVTFTLTNSLYELIFINIRYGSSRPRAVVLETSRDGGMTFNPIQYYADDCMQYFGLPDDGPVINANDVTCITTTSLQQPTFNIDVRTRLLDPARTANFDLNTSPELLMFILASHLRVRFVDYFETSTTIQHRYYNILEATVVARCACYGHAARCGNDIDSVCQCLDNTEGTNCERCLPFYNDKPWSNGTTTDAFPCKECNCNGHASSCHYNSTVDPFPLSRDLGGGGVCDGCQDNTAGVNCETCAAGYFSLPGTLPSDPTPCTPCGCNTNGISDGIGDCSKGQSSGGENPGQCFCKPHVTSLKCDTCRVGFFNLTSSNPDGCTPCGCNTAGTFDSVDTCDVLTGQCLCKRNIEGVKCDRCMAGTTNLTAANPLGCSECQCNTTGAVSSGCDPESGVCVCKPGVGGGLCDICLPGFFGFSETGCQQCTCVSEGSLSDLCDPVTGVCVCRENVIGDRCDECGSGFHNLSAGCLSCGCDSQGTENGTLICDRDTGMCPCKTNVEGDMCDLCVPGFTNLIGSNPDGCSLCDCFSPNTDLSGVVCDPITSQCDCVAMAMGLRCDACVDGFYQTEGGCVECGCDSGGAASPVCDVISGQCVCTSEGVGGRRCDSCLIGFFQFPTCQSCGCNAAGAEDGTVCNALTGECSCKRYVTGTVCDTCIAGFQQLEANNPFGCSAAPDEQAPPTATPISSTSILLTWLEPEAPNGVITSYRVYRNSLFISTVSARNYTDVGLVPDSRYSYTVEAINVVGSTLSQETTAQTQEGVPTGIRPPDLQPLNAIAISASWVGPTVPNGVVQRFELVMVTLGPEQVLVDETVVFNSSGNVFSTVVSGLMPFTVYTFLVRACTSGGCGSSETSEVQTLEAPPTFQPAPNVTTQSAEVLLITWESPPTPNGVITNFEVRQRDFPFDGEGIFLVNTTVLLFEVQSLRPFTMYEFSVSSFTGGGGTRSMWVRGTTAEAAPDGVDPPTVSALSSNELQIEWKEPNFPNGIIRRYGIYQITMVTSEVLIGSFSTEPGTLIVSELSPFTEYSFLLEVCTSVDCSRSNVTSERTLEGVPIGQPDLMVDNATSSSLSLMWAGPSMPNGIISSYSLQRRSLPTMVSQRDVGVAFNGNGIASFPPGETNLGGFSNEIRLRFRTLQPEGVILYYINTARTDLLAIELRNGVPYFVFDAGSGTGVVRPDFQGGPDVLFNDGEWHTVVVSQTGQTGIILIDGVYTGANNSIGTDSVISSSQALHIGGIPDSAPLQTVTGAVAFTSRLIGQNFAGCVFGVVLNGQTLDFSLSDPSAGVDVVNGCPVGLERGWSFIGGGFLTLSENIISSSDVMLTFGLRTSDSNTLVVFVHSSDLSSGIGIEIRNSALNLVVNSNGMTSRTVAGDVGDACDGGWHRVRLVLAASSVSLSLDASLSGSLFLSSDVLLSSAVYFGGIPRDSMGYNLAVQMGLGVGIPLSGCVRMVELVTGEGGGVEVTPVVSLLVRFDGCGLGGALSCDTPLNRNTGTNMTFSDVGLNPFTDYLYRVGASNSAGTALSGWVATRTLQGIPFGIGLVSLVTRTSSSLTVTWDTPTSPNGLITSYDIIATPTQTAGLDTPIGNIMVESIQVQEPEMTLLVTVTGLEPATTHMVTITAFTSAGDSIGPPLELVTSEAVPVGVQVPVVTLTDSRRLGVAWAPPTLPNGVIVRFDLFIDGQIVFSGSVNATVVDNLSPFTEYLLFVQACTNVGCANGSIATGQTLPDRPMGLAAPSLTVLSPSAIEATWVFPTNPNGAIQRFELRRLFSPDLSQFEVVFDGLGQETTITGLTPNTVYSFQLFVYNAGGSGSSPIVSARTLEGVPDGVSEPTVVVVNATALSISWTEPTIPNGVISQYILLQNGTIIFTGLSFSFLLFDLQPFTYYSFSLVACTVRNCSSSIPTIAMTPEATPQGYVSPSITRVTPFAIELTVNPVTNPNGIASYILSVGLEGGTRLTVYNSSLPGAILVDNLSPFTNYSIVLEVLNTAGVLVGPEFIVQTSPTVPEGFSSPDLTLINATTLRVDWSLPDSPNGLILSYELTVVGGSTVDVRDVGLTLTSTVAGLQPFTLYTVTVRVVNTEGGVASPSANITTGETAPTGFDRVVATETNSRYIVVSWDEPAAINGILVNYTVLQGGVVIVVTPPSVTTYNVTSLRPFTSYNFSVQACTSVGCVESPSLVAMTTEDAPKGLPELSITFISGRVLISWPAPSQPNGIVTEYRIERDGIVVGSVPVGPDSVGPFVLVDISTEPFQLYLYRLVAENSAGVSIGPASNFTTPQAAPDAVSPPLLTPLSSTSIAVRFMNPVTPNGIITMYTLIRSPPVTTVTFTPESLPTQNPEGEFEYVDTDLSPFTRYTYTLQVCTSGGCADSGPSSETTMEDTPQGVAMPTVTVVSSEEILVTWTEPGMPNGVIVDYDLLRRFVGFEIADSSLINCCEEYINNQLNETSECEYVANTDSNVTSFTDNDLRPFTYYQYCIIVTNNVDSAFSNETTPTQTSPAPMPLAGPQLNATTLNSTAIQVSWGSVEISDLLGPLNSYTLYVGESGSPGLGDQLFSGLDQSFVVTGLIASTEYVFIVAVSNGQGAAFSNNATAITEEGIPANLPDPLVEPSSTSLSVSFSEPAEPNGVIIVYTIFLDSVAVRNETAPGTVVLSGLTPYTLYIVQVEACTQFGCTRSSIVPQRTLEGIPVGLASPIVSILGPTSASITWRMPNQPNGNITEYRLLQFTQSAPEPVFVFSGIGFQISVSDLAPFTEYSYQVIAYNGAGNVSSILTRATTDEAPPSFVTPPIAQVRSSSEIFISWTEPQELNGILIGYRVYRGDNLVSSTLSLSYLDEQLEPFSTYTYHLEACTNGGCTNSSLISNTTFEALPEQVGDPVLTDLGARALTISWQPPNQTNGIITEYILTLMNNNTEVFRGLAISFELTSLTPFTNYTFILETCNSVGCVPGRQLGTQTLQARPEGLAVPRLRNLTSTSVAIEWSEPTATNGDIINYILYRGNESFPDSPVVIFQGLGFAFNDVDLLADTLYFYTIEAVNTGGSVTSPPSYFQTVPDLPGGIAPPVVEVRGATEIHVSWSAPTLPNGDISGYILYINGNAVPLGIAFEYSAIGLLPFNVYSFYFEVCNQAGCASSITVTEVTEQALPSGVNPPSLDILGPTAIQVSWSPPNFPNGVISMYEIRRRLLNNPFTETIQHIGDSSIFSFPNSGLQPFTSYEYRLNVYNGAGSTFSEWEGARTDEDIPAGLPLPMFADEDIFARNVTATWGPPSMPNGVVLNYRLEYRTIVDPATNLPGNPIEVATVPANVTMATAFGLLPITTYEFRVVVINGAGEGSGEYETVTTREDVPEDIQPITVEQRTGTTISLLWNPPLTPNGQIREYLLYLDNELVYRDLPSTNIVQRLQPFTSYTLQLAACTSAGCTLGVVQSVTTAEVAPDGQASPLVTALSAESVEVTWNPPSQSNGIITMYEILRQDNGVSSSLIVLFSTTDTLTRLYIDNTVQPAMDYQYAVRAINSVGQDVSEFRPIRTPEAPPEGIPPPQLTVVSSSSIDLTWSPPTQSNGIIQMYQLFRSGGGAVNTSVYNNPNRAFTDTNLMPFTEYSYFLQACTSAGCTSGPPVLAITNEDTPEDFPPPLLSAISESSILISWSAPISPNGIIQSYRITISPGEIIVTTTDLSRVITSLFPFTLYTVTIEACNAVGCITNGTSIRTLESTPQFIRPPQLTAINATTVRTSWTEPSRPNGIVIRYILRRNSSVVFDGNSSDFTDTGLDPNTHYSYTIQAYTSVGGGDESTPPAVLQTPPDTPEGILPPSLQAMGPTSVRVMWSVPSQPNGVIQRYVLFLNGQEVFSGVGFVFEAQELQPFTEYAFYLMVCTTTCNSSEEVRVTTLEAPPTGQAPPTLTANGNTTVLVDWTTPSAPNGVITRYEVERRFVADSANQFLLIFNQLPQQLEFLDNHPLLRPAMTYEYRVTAINNAGSVTSDLVQVTLLDAAPEGNPALLVSDLTPTSLNITAQPPAQPNGLLTVYRLYRNGDIVMESIPDSQTAIISFIVTSLMPFTVHTFYLEVCTSGGCGQSEPRDILTDEAPPTGLGAPIATAVSSRSIRLTWSPPSQANGVVQGYSLWFQTACPQPPQPLLTTPLCVVGPRTLIVANQTFSQGLVYMFIGSGSVDPRPYSTYQFQVGAVNNAGGVESVFSVVIETPSDVPEPLPERLGFIKDDASGLLYLDWSEAFQFNGKLIASSVERNGILLVQRPITSFNLTSEPRGIDLMYVITVVTVVTELTTTETRQPSITRVTRLGPDTTQAPPTNITTVTPPVPTQTPFYQQAAFIVGMVVLGVIIVFVALIGFICCVRPRGDSGYKATEREGFPQTGDTPRHSRTYSRMSGTPSPKPVTGSWSPGDAYDGDIPEMRSDDPGPVVTRRGKSYSPRRLESASLIENEHLQLPDTHIASHVSPKQFVPASDDFGSFKAQQQTTFTDTKV